jgi:amino acid adenylation domain-containing protein
MTKTLKLNAGERVILSFPPGPEFLPVILACFATGIIAVPTYPPNPGSWEKDTARLALIAKVSGSKCVLTNKVFMLVVHASRLKSFFGGGGKASVGIPWKSVPDSILFSSGKRYPLTPYPVKPDDVAFLQFTSGSTGDPKGVVVRHGALVHNLASMQRHLLIQPGRTLVSWMPQYHDFGLIVMMLLPTMYGGHAICMSPLSFLKDPIVWLSTITKYRGYITASPNFGYARCVIAWNRLPVEKRPTLDLSNLRWTSNAAEPIRISTLRDFQETFGPFGFKESAMIPSYGLAEHVVYAGSVWESGVYVDPSRGFVACVKIGSDEDIEFIIMSHGGEDGGDAETPTSIPDGEDGEIWMHSPSVAGEYWGRPEKTKETFQNPYGGKLWLRTGDLGYIKDGRLFITGRLKDVIIVSGRNVYPQDVEVTVEKLSKDIRPGCSAAFQVNTGLGDDSNLPPDAIGMVVELRKAKVPRETMVQLLSEIRQAVTKNHGLSIHQFAFVKPRTIPKTTSGKIRRSTCKEMMSKGGAGLEIVSDGLFDTGSIDDLSSSSMMEPMATEDEITMLLRSTSSVKDLESNCTPEMQIGARVVGVISDVTGIAPGTLALDVPMSELGIGSLQAIHIGSEIEDTFGVTLDLALFLEGGTLEQVIEVVTKEAGKRKERKGPSKGPPVSESQVASFNQSQMFILDSFGAGSALNIPFAIRFKGTVNVDALKKAAGLVVCRHPCLRSHFETSTGPSDGDGSRPTVRYSDLNSFRLPWDEKEVVVENDEALMVIIQTEATRPFDLRSGPLVRAVLLHALDGEEDNIVLIWTMHHAISDGWSVFVVMKDLASAYNQFVSNSTEPVLPALPTSYELFTKWQQNEVANWGDSIQYWRSKLTGAPEYLALPYKRSDGGNSAGILPLNIPSDVLDKLNALAGTEETTLFTVLAAITSSMLMQFCDQTDITIGAPTSGRDSFPGLTGQVGYFVNTFVMRFQSDPEDSFQEYLQFCKKEVTSCRAHDAVPYQCVLQEALKSTRTPFQVYLILQDSRLLQMTDSFHGVESDPIFDIALEKAQFELAFELIPADNGLRGRLVFNEDKLDRKVALSLAHAFQHVCTAIAEDSARAMRAIPLIDEQDDELREIFRLSAGELQPKYFTAKAAHKAFESHAAKNPKSVCLVLDDQSMTYGEVDGKANVLARALVKRGIKANVAVAILSLRSFEMVIAMLAVMKSGGCYVPLDAELPVDRLQGYIEDSAAPLVLTVSMHQEMASQMISASSNKTCAILLVDKLEKDGGNAGTSVSVSENDAAYIEFTSGSTGRPKGVVVPHRALSDFLCWAQDTWSLTKNDPGLLLISIQFDPHVAAIFTPLFVGSKLVIARPGGHNDPEYIMELMAKHRVAFCPSVPSFGWDHFRTKSAGKCDNLRGYLFGGEPLQPEIIPLVQRATPHKMPVCNVYGPTEATVLITLATFTQENMVDGIHLGRPNANAHCYVVNASMEPVPVGAPGELLLSGPRLAIGYIGRQELTNEKFVVNPFISKIREWVPKGMERYYNRVYKTGDLVRWRADGNLDYLGRIDRQVKVNGVRIELGEIETCILSMDGVEQAIVTPSFDEATGIKRLVAYITPEGCSPNEVVAHCKRNLIPAMVPSAVLSLGRFPVTANGKVDVKALPPVDWNELSVEVEYVAPKTNTEEKIQKIWGEVLGKGHGDEIYISCIADFLSVGGTSLLVIRMAGIIQERFDLGVPLNRLHELSTIQEMGEYIDGLAINTSGMNSKLVRHDWTGEEFLPLSYGMEQMYTLSQFDQTGCQYNEPLLVDFVGELNVELMRDALLSVMVRQQMLRICIGENGLIDLGEGGRLMDRLPIQTVDLSKSIDNYTGDPRQNPQIEQVLLKSAREPFKLSERAPLWRLLLVKLSDKRTVGLFTLHHAIMDGWSMGVVVSDLCTAYNDMGQPLAPLPVQYVDYAKWNRQWLSSPDAQGNSEWWFENLESATKLVQLPHDYPRPQAPSGKGGSVHATLDQETVALVKRFAARNSVTRYSIFVSIYRALLCRLSGSNDLIIGTTASNRPVNTEEIIGYMLNVLPLHNRIDESDNLLSLCQSELKTLKAALGHGMLPFQKIVEVAKVERSAAYNPLVQVLITTEEEGFLPRLSMNKLKPTQVEYFHTETNKMDMNLAFFPLEDEYVVGIEYNADIFAPNTAQAFLDMYITLLGRAIRNPGEKLMALPMMSPQSMGSIFSRLCAGPLRPDYVQGPLTTQLFEMWARKSTASPCLVFENETLSYGEVNDRANRMARKLVDLGVGRNVAVGLMMDRSFELVISMLAAMKAGGCYVPLDPDYPDDRLSIYMEDSSAAVLVAGREHLARANQLGGENANWSVLIAEDFDWNSGDSSNLSENLIARDSLAYVIFTSGSTGRPKGVMIDHIALLDFVRYNLEYYNVTERDTCLLSITINFDPHVMQVFTGLAGGSRLVIAKPGGHVDAEYMSGLIADWDVSFYNTVPALGLEYYKTEGAKRCTSLKSAIFSGEAMPIELVDLIYRNVPQGVQVVNAYGPTEATVMATNLRCEPGMTSMTIGFPEYNMHCYIVDASMNMVPPGVPGELLLSGPRLAQGYIGRPDLTAEKFTENPCYLAVKDSLPKELLSYFAKAYRTGDLCRFKQDGQIDYLGRIDNQVKINGVRLELSEVEAALGTAPHVDQAIVIAIKDPISNEKRLVGYVTPGDVDVDIVGAHCRSRLIPAMVPSAFVAMDAFPLLPNGKVNAKALPTPVFKSAGPYQAPRTILEEKLQAIWTTVLGLQEPISVLEDFFTAGGTSLQVFKLNGLMASELSVAFLPPTFIHTHRTIRSAATALEKLQVSGRDVAVKGISARSWPDALRPLSANQEQMWIIYKTDPRSCAYNMPLLLTFSGGSLDQERLRESLNALAAQHENLRMHFKESEDAGSAVCEISDLPFTVPLEVSESYSLAEVERIIRTPFDLETDALVRVHLWPGKESRLLVVLHHAVADAWSQKLFLDSLASAYNQTSKGDEIRLEQLPVQYGDFASWQKEHLTCPEAETHRGYWKENLSGSPDRIQLPTKGPRLGNVKPTAESISLKVPPAALSKAAATASTLGVNLQAVLMACLQIILCRYSDQDEVIVGVPVAGREMTDTHNLIGYFINTIPVRGGIADGGSSFGSLCIAASQTLQEGLNHSSLPLTDILAAAGARRSHGINPLFQVLFQYIPDAESVSVTFEGVEKVDLCLTPPALNMAKLDLLISLNGTGDLNIEYMDALYDVDTIERIGRCFVSVLSTVVADPSVRVSDISLVTDEDLRLVKSFATGCIEQSYFSSPYPVHMFEDAALKHPDRVALECEGATMTYGRLNTLANILAAKLASKGIQHNSCVGIMLHRSFELIICMLAVLKTGAGYLTLDPDYPDERLAIYAEDSRVDILLASDEVKLRAKSLYNGEIVTVDKSFTEQTTERSVPNLPRDLVQFDGACYAIFTSGSTGRPKGAQLLHGGLRDLILWMLDYWGCTETDKVAMTNTISFDAHVLQVYPPLCVGGTLAIAKPGGHLDAEYLANFLVEKKITGILFSVPTLSREWAKALPSPCPSLRMHSLGGEVVTKEDMYLMRSAFPNIEGPHNAYGPTEVTALTVCWKMIDGHEGPLPLGRPNTNVQAYVVDSKLRPVPVGVPGELLLSGPRLGRGYIGREDLTNAAFIPNPCFEFIDVLPTLMRDYYRRAYRTGDLVRWLPDGNIEYLGRIDRQVKVNGVRIELGEVEETLMARPDVDSAIAQAVLEPSSGMKRLVGYVTPKTADIGRALEHCRDSLIAAMVPSVIVPLEHFPVLPNGKVDAKSLPAPDWSGEEVEYIAPRNDVEKCLQEIWMDALGTSDSISVLTDFFSAGGTSIQVFKVIAQMQKMLGLSSLAPTIVQENRTIAGVAEAIQRMDGVSSESGPEPLVWEDDLRPLSANQEQMWVLFKSLGSSSAYNVPVGLRVQGNVDLGKLQLSLDNVVGRHETLRSYFVESDGEASIKIKDSLSYEIERYKCRSEDTLASAVANFVREPIDILKAPLFRVKLFQGPAPDGNLLVTTMHHSISDGWSMEVFLQEIAGSYRTCTEEGVPDNLGALHMQYGDYASWQQKKIKSQFADHERQWWRQKLLGIPLIIQLPADRTRPENPTSKSGNLRLNLPVDLMENLSTVASSLQVNMQAVLLSALQVMLSKYSGQDDVVIGMPTAGRDLPSTHPLIGYFINTTAVRSLIDLTETLETHIRRTSRSVLECQQHSFLPFAHVVAALNLQRQSNANPVFQVMFQYLANAESSSFDFGDLQTSVYEMPALGAAKVDLQVVISSSGRVIVDYAAELFDELTIRRFLTSFRLVLESMVSAPGNRIGSVRLQTPAEVAAILSKFSPGPYSAQHLTERLVPDAIDCTATEKPERVMLVFEGREMTYGEVNRRANSLAAHLVDQGVERNVVVGLMLERSFDLVVSTLAIWKAGGIYLPLDPDYPDERLRIYLEDTNASALISVGKHLGRFGKVSKGSVGVTVDLESFWSRFDATKPVEGVKSSIRGEDGAYIEFTSGSTGRPKAMLISHRNFTAYCATKRDTLRLNADTCSILTISINFDPHIRQSWAHLFLGGKLVIASPGRHVDADYVMQLVADSNVSYIYTVPTLGLEYFASPYAKACKSLKYAVFSGERLPAELVELVGSNTPAKLPSTNVYGPTECTLSSTTCVVKKGEEVTIGRPDHNVHCYIVDSGMHPVPIGVPGELLLSGPRLSKGYIGRPDLTSDVFIDNPCYDLIKNGVPGALRQEYSKAYRTGDLVRWRKDGVIEYLGRIDRQVKIEGVRVELGEVESAMEAHPRVARAVAKAVPDPRSGKNRLVGYIVPSTVDESEVRSECQKRLVSAMVPAMIVKLDAFPLLPNGKGRLQIIANSGYGRC